MPEFRKVYLLGLIVGIILEAVGFASLANYFANNAGFNYLLDGLGVVIVGILFLIKSVPVFIPIKQQTSNSRICSKCGAIVAEDAIVCEKCKQQLDTSDIKN